MSRDLHANTTTALQQKVVRPVLLVRLDIDSDAITAWTGNGLFAPTGTGDTALDGQNFSPLAPVLEMSNIQEDQGIAGPVSLTLTGHDIDSEALRQVVRDARKWRGQPAYIWMGLLNSDEATIVSNPVRIKTGVMVSMRVIRKADTAIVETVIDEDLGNSRSAPYRWVDHAKFYSSDTFSTYVVKLANKPRGLEKTDVRGGVATPGPIFPIGFPPGVSPGPIFGPLPTVPSPPNPPVGPVQPPFV